MFKTVINLVIIIFSSQNIWALSAVEKVEQAKARCEVAQPGEPVLYSSDFHWFYSAEEMKQRFSEVYDSGKRLAQRTYFDQTQDKFFVNHVGFSKLTPVHLSENFIKNITHHIEGSLKQGYTEFIFFPDMGHSHMMIDEDYYMSEIKNMPVAEMAQAYEKMLNHKKSKFLYHTAEQLKMEDENKMLLLDRHTQWRFYTRNLVGTNDLSKRLQINAAIETRGNTLADADEGFRMWSAGYHVSASKDGCFAYESNGKIFYYDISLQDLAPNPNDPGSGGFGEGNKAKALSLSNQQMPLWIWNSLNVWKY